METPQDPQWIEIFNEPITDDDVITKYKNDFKKSTPCTVLSATTHGRYRVACEMFENVIAFKKYNFALRDLDKIILKFPSNRLMQLLMICQKYDYKLDADIRLRIAVRTNNDLYLEHVINVENCFNFADYLFILHYGTVQQITKYYEKIALSIASLIRLKDYLSDNFLSEMFLAERPALLDFFCSKGLIAKKLKTGSYVKRLYPYIKKWKLVLTDESLSHQDEFLAYAGGCDEMVCVPEVRKLPPDTEDFVSLEMIKPGELFLSCGRHFLTYASMRAMLLEFEGDARCCPFCKKRIPYKIFLCTTDSIDSIEVGGSESGIGSEN